MCSHIYICRAKEAERNSGLMAKVCAVVMFGMLVGGVVMFTSNKDWLSVGTIQNKTIEKDCDLPQNMETCQAK